MDLTPTPSADLEQHDPLTLGISTWLGSLTSTHTRSAYRNDINQFITWSQEANGTVDLRLMTPGHIKVFISYCTQRGESGKTVGRRLSSLSSLYQHLMAQPGTGVEANPVTHPIVKRPSTRANQPTAVIGPQQLQAMAMTAAAMGPRTELIIELCSLYGLRASEVGWLSLDDISSTPNGTRLRVRGKGATVDYLDLDQATCDVLADWLEERADLLLRLGHEPEDPQGPLLVQTHNTGTGPGTAMTRHGVAWVVHQVSLVALEVAITPHVLRKSTSQALFQDMTPQQMRQWGRWRSLTTVQIYLEESVAPTAPTLQARDKVAQAAARATPTPSGGRMRPLRHHRKDEP